MSTVKKTKSTEKSANGNALSVVKAKEEVNASDDLQKRLEALEAENKRLSTSVQTFRKSKQEKEAELKKEKAERERIAKELKFRQPESVNDVLVKAEALKALSDKLKKLQEKKKELTAFSFASSSLGESVTLQDSGGKHFKTSNPEALKLIKESLEKLVEGKIAETENKLLEIA